MTKAQPESPIQLAPIGVVRTASQSIPRHWTVSEVQGELHLNEEYQEGLQDIHTGQRIVVLFHFHRSPAFSPSFLVQKPPHKDREFGVFSICSPKRPNPLGLSVLDVLEVRGSVIIVQGIDMLDGTPILDIKPYIPAPAASEAHAHSS